MSTPARWIAAILLVLFGIAVAFGVLFVGAVMQIPGGWCAANPEWAVDVLDLAALLIVAAAVVPAVATVRRSGSARPAIYLILAAAISFGGYAAALKHC